jgi:hypothetical protein
MSIQIGDKVRDAVTGFTGIVVARAEWLNGCVRLVVQSQALDKDGNPTEGQNFDEDQMVLVKAGVVARPKKAGTSERTGGPFPAVKRGARLR